MDRKIIGVPSRPEPKGTSGKVFSQQVIGAQGAMTLTVFADDLDYANSIVGMEGEYSYYLSPAKPNPNGGMYKESYNLVNPSKPKFTKKAPYSVGNPKTNSPALREMDQGEEILKKLDLIIEELAEIKNNQGFIGS